MSSLSKSTLLLNCLIALSTKTPDFPCPLWENGFQIEKIEPKILLSDRSTTNPDIQFKRNDDLLLFFECKDGNCEKDQLDRYKKLTPDDIKRQHATVLNSPNLSFDLAYFSTKEKEEKIIKSIEGYGNTFPILILDESAIKFHQKSNEFKNQLLNEILKEVQYNSPIPQNFIPFTADDDEKTILCILLQHFATKNEYQFTLDQLLDELFPQFMVYYHQEARDALRGRLGKLLKKLMQREEFLHIIVKRENSYDLQTTKRKTFMKNCQKVIKEMKDGILKEENQIRSPQATFNEFFQEF